MRREWTNTLYMLGKSAAPAALALVSILALAACPKNVPQDKATGPDGKVKGAKPITLAANEGKTSGIVNYPGGDRVDWKVIELPKDKAGTMSLRLSWIPPRPGLGLGLDVFDQYGRLIKSERGGKRRSTRRNRKIEVSPALGKYWVRVYAATRGDAGKYTLKVKFEDQIAGFDVKSLQIPDPPRLAAVPAAALPCEPFDKKNPSCADVCPTPIDPNWAPCKGVCPNLPVGDINVPACWPVMECPVPALDRKIRKCLSKFPPCNFAAKDPLNPNCDGPPPPVKGKVINVQVGSNGVNITINRGQDKSVERGWRGKIIKKDTNRPMEGGEFEVIKVGKRESVGIVKGLTSDQITSNPDVILEAP